MKQSPKNDSSLEEQHHSGPSPSTSSCNSKEPQLPVPLQKTSSMSSSHDMCELFLEDGQWEHMIVEGTADTLWELSTHEEETVPGSQGQGARNGGRLSKGKDRAEDKAEN